VSVSPGANSACDIIFRMLSAPAVRHAVQIARNLSAHRSEIFSYPHVRIISYQLPVKQLVFDNLYSVNYPRCTELPQIGNKPTLFRCAVRVVGAMQRAADLGRSHGGIMRIGRNIIISAILALSGAGSILASVAVPAATVQASGSHVHVTAMTGSPNTFYRG
jgi:hypothetical protein